MTIVWTHFKLFHIYDTTQFCISWHTEIHFSVRHTASWISIVTKDWRLTYSKQDPLLHNAWVQQQLWSTRRLPRAIKAYQWRNRHSWTNQHPHTPSEVRSWVRTPDAPWNCIRYPSQMLLVVLTDFQSTDYANKDDWPSFGLLSRVVWQMFTDVSDILRATIIRTIMINRILTEATSTSETSVNHTVQQPEGNHL